MQVKFKHAIANLNLLMANTYTNYTMESNSSWLMGSTSIWVPVLNGKEEYNVIVYYGNSYYSILFVQEYNIVSCYNSVPNQKQKFGIEIKGFVKKDENGLSFYDDLFTAKYDCLDLLNDFVVFNRRSLEP